MCVWLIALLAVRAEATNIQVVQLDEQAAAADVIVEGTIETQWYEAPAEARGFVVTRSVLVVDHEYKGHVVSGKVVITTPGGFDSEGYQYSVAGTPSLRPHDHVIVHLVESDATQSRLHNWSAGLLFVDDVTGSVVDGQRNFLGVDAAGNLLPLRDARTEDRLSLDDLRQLISESAVQNGRTIAGYMGGAK